MYVEIYISIFEDAESRPISYIFAFNNQTVQFEADQPLSDA